MGIEKHRRPIMAPAFLNEDGTPYDPGIGQFVPLAEKGAANGVATLDSTIKVPNAQLHLGEAGGPASLDGSGKISASELPPLQHDTAEAADEASMLALDVSAPAMVVRTDFTPPHIFMLTADPATDIDNWHDTGELGAGAADPSAKVGPVATNGVANTFMRSDAAPAIDMTAAYAWTGVHGFSEKISLTGGADLGADIAAHGSTVTGLADPSDAQDAATKNYVDTGGPVKRVSGTVQLELKGEDLVWPVDVETGKIRLYDSTPGSDNTFYGLGVQNGVQVYQVDSDTSAHVFQGVDDSDNALEIFRASMQGGIVSKVDLHLESDSPLVELQNTAAAANEKRWNWATFPDQISLSAVSDDGNTVGTAWLITRSGATVTAHSIQAGGNPLLEISAASDIVANVDLHMSEKKVVNMGDPDSARDAVNLQTLNGRISAAQRSAIDALPTSGNSADDVVAALQAA